MQILGRLSSPAQFEDVVLKAGTAGDLVKLKDVGRAEMGAERYSTFARYSGHPAVGYQILQTPGSNSLAIAKAVKAEMARLAERFPPGLIYEIPYDSSRFVEASFREVIITLLQAVGLVVLVIFIFLQDWRTTVIPAITIPVSLLGTFAFVKVLGFSLNSLTLFGLTLATGMVVDDAIVIVEDISRLIQREGLLPVQAAIASMRQLFGAVIATSLVLMAVFVPVGFFPGTAGQVYQQFALTIAFAIAISTLNALTPVLAALLLRAQPRQTGWLGWSFRRINGFLTELERSYRWSLGRLTRLQSLALVGFAGLLVATGWLYTQVPQVFLSEEDQGYFISILQGPDGTSLNYTEQVVAQAEQQLLAIPELKGTFAMGGVGFNGNTPNRGILFAPLKSWKERQQPEQSVTGILNRVRMPLMGIPQAPVIAPKLCKSLSMRFLALCKPTWVPATSTISTPLAAPIGSMCRPCRRWLS